MSDEIPPSESGSASSAAVASPAASSTSASSSAGTTTGAESGASTPQPVPYDRFDQVNKGYTKLKWAESYDPQTVESYARFFNWLDQDPTGAHNYLTDYLTRSGALKSSKDNGHDELKPLVVPETGQRFYTADQVDKIAQMKIDQALNSRLAPIEQSMHDSQARSQARQIIAEVEQRPYFKEHEGELLKAMEADKRLSLEGAYARVVLPKIRALERQAVLAELNQKPGASTVNPGSSAASDRVPASKMSLQDLFRREMSKQSRV